GAKVAQRQADAADPRPQPADGDGAGTLLAAGEFRGADSAHQGSGRAEVQRLPDGRLNLFLSDFSVTNGPDLYVYLVPRGADSSVGVSLGRLEANNGNQNYAIPPGTDITAFDRVVIWCRRFDVDFAIAALAATGDAAASQPATPTPVPGTPGTPPTATATQPPATPSPTPPAPAPAGPGVVAAGSFVDGEPGHQGSGAAELQRLAGGKLNLFLSNFSVTNGPDLVVVLSEDPGGSRASVSGGLTLDKLKANNGNQNYEIPAGTDIGRFKSVIIYCKTFPTVFAYATLEAK
ncbi:MAG: DM13 domain-containing protein, partial [Gemmatimonadales bacterium]